MADKKISALPAVLQQNIASTTDVLPIVNAGATKKATAYAITYSSLNASVATTFAYDATPTVATRIGVQGTGTSWIFNGPSPNPNYATGLVVDSTYDSGTRQAETNLRALGIYSSGGYGSELSLWTSNGTAIARQVTVKNNGDVQVKTGNLVINTAGKGLQFANTTWDETVVASYKKSVSTTIAAGSGRGDLYFAVDAAKTFTVTSVGLGGLVTIVYGSAGEAATFFWSWNTATISILGNGGTMFAATSTPSASQFGIYKSANSSVLNFKSGSSFSPGNISICFIGNYALATTDPA